MTELPAQAAPSLSLVAAVLKHRWLVAGVALLAGLSGFGLSQLQDELFEAEANLLLSDPAAPGVFRELGITYWDNTRYVRNRARLVSSTPVVARTAELLAGEPAMAGAAGSVVVEPSHDLDLISIRARHPSPQGAAALANATAQAYQDVVAAEVRRNADASLAELEDAKVDLHTQIRVVESQLADRGANTALQAERDGYVAQLVTLEARARQIAVDAALYGSGVDVFEAAGPPSTPVEPQPLRNGLVAGLLGLLVGAALAWWQTERRQVVETRDDPAAALQAPLLGEVPEFRAVGAAAPLPIRTAPQSAASEAYQFIVASLHFALPEPDGTSTVLVTSAGQGDGKSVTALNLAAAAAQDGRRVVLVDADTRVRGLTRLSSLSPTHGLADLAEATVPFERCAHTLKVSDRVRVPFVSAGSEPMASAGFFRTPGFRHAMHRIQERGDLVVVDSPPLLAVADTSAMAAACDGIVLVVVPGTPLRVLAELRRRLDLVGTPVLGYVYNRTRQAGKGYGQDGYGYRYEYGYGTNGNGNGHKAAKPAKRRKAGRSAGRT